MKIVPPLLGIEERELLFSEVDCESGGIIDPSFNPDLHFGIRRVDETHESFLNLLRCRDYFKRGERPFKVSINCGTFVLDTFALFSAIFFALSDYCSQPFHFF